MEKYTLDEIREIVSDIGLGQSIQGNLIYEKIEDEELKKLWGQAKEIMGKIENKLK